MESFNLDEENIIKDIRNLFRLKKKLNYTAIKDIRNIFRREKETTGIKDRILRDIKSLFEHEEKNYYKPVRVSNFRVTRVTIVLIMKVTVIKIKHYQ